MKKHNSEWETICREVLELYERSAVGRCLHIVLDDGNIDEGDVLCCLNNAYESGHPDCYILANRLLFLT